MAKQYEPTDADLIEIENNDEDHNEEADTIIGFALGIVSPMSDPDLAWMFE